MFGLYTLSGADQGIALKISAKPDKVTIGDRIELAIEATHPISFALQPSTMTALGDFLITQATVKKAGPQTDDVTLALVTFSTGTVTVPSFSLQYWDPQSHPLSVKTPEVTIHVDSVLDKHKDRSDIQEIKGQVGFFDPWPWIIGLAILGLAALITWFLTQRKRREHALNTPPEPPRPPETVAREALERLRNNHLIEEGRTKEFYIQLSEILRRYTEGRFHVPCLDMTTSEIARELKSLTLSSSDFSNLRNLLQDCDLVKFAKFMPAPDEPARHIGRAFEFVDHTTPRMTPEEAS